MAKQYTKGSWTDQIAASLRWIIKDTSGATILSALNSAQLNTDPATISTPGTPVTKARMDNIENGIDALDLLVSGTGPISPYKFVVTIVANDIVVALKDQAGNDFSPTNPGYFQINGVRRTVTAALSLTIAHGAQSGNGMFNAGSLELATKPIDLFIYVGWKSAATAAVSLGASRIPWACVQNDFSSTAANEKYAVFSTALASTDDVAVIGRIDAQNSGTASYNWSSASQSAPTSVNTLFRWTDKSRLLQWNPTKTYAGGTLDPTSNTIQVAQYYLSDRFFNAIVQSVIVRGTGNRTIAVFSLPITPPNTYAINAMDSVTAASNKNATAAYISSNTANVVETMANDGNYYVTVNLAF